MAKQRGTPSTRQQVKDAEFRTREFGMNTEEASRLVARDGLPAEKLKQEIAAPDSSPRLPDPLENVPVPSGPPTELTTDTDEQSRKPVVRTANDKRGAG